MYLLFERKHSSTYMNLISHKWFQLYTLSYWSTTYGWWYLSYLTLGHRFHLVVVFVLVHRHWSMCRVKWMFLFQPTVFSKLKLIYYSKGILNLQYHSHIVSVLNKSVYNLYAAWLDYWLYVPKLAVTPNQHCYSKIEIAISWKPKKNK